MQDGGVNVFTWSVANAKRYEIIGNKGRILYSGVDSRWAIPWGMPHHYTAWPWIFKAYSNDNRDSPVVIIDYWPTWKGLTTHDPSG